MLQCNGKELCSLESVSPLNFTLGTINKIFHLKSMSIFSKYTLVYILLHDDRRFRITKVKKFLNKHFHLCIKVFLVASEIPNNLKLFSISSCIVVFKGHAPDGIVILTLLLSNCTSLVSS